MQSFPCLLLSCEILSQTDARKRDTGMTAVSETDREGEMEGD